MKKKLISLFLVGIMAVSMIAGCGSDDNTQAESKKTESAETGNAEVGSDGAGEELGVIPGEFPISEEPITIRIMVPRSTEHSTPFAELEYLQEYEKMTNVHIEWEEVSQEAYEEKYKLALASGDLPDAFGAGFSYDSSVIYKYAQEGMIVPLDEYIESSTVNIKKWMNDYDEFRKLSTYPDGHIYALPSIDENQNIRVDDMLYINQTWLDQLGLETPTNLDELGDYLRIATTTDLNGDGKNEYGLSFQAESPSMYSYLFGYFGVAWDEKSYMNAEDGTTELKFAPSMDETREALEYFHEWYEEGLLDPENFTQSATQLKAKGKTEGVAASVIFWYLGLNDGDESVNEYRLVDMLEGPNDNAVWRRNGLIPGYSANQFFITSANEYPEETLAFIDYWMDNSVNALTNRFGPQGYSWDWVDEEAGTWTELANIPSGEVRTQANSTLYCTWGYGIPYWCFGDFWSQKNITAANALERQEGISTSYIKVAPVGLPDLVYDEAENREALNIKTDLFDYVDSQIAQFITDGVTDESWNEYLSKLEALQADRWTELYNKYYSLMME